MSRRCTEPGCAGTIVDDMCQVCGAFAESPAPQPVLAAARSSKQVRVPAVSTKSSVSSRPSSLSSLAAMQSLKKTARRTDISTKTVSERNTLGGELVHIEPPPPVEPLKLLREDLALPVSQRVCSNPKCVDPAGNPNSLVRIGPDGQPIMLEKGFCGKCRTPFSFEKLKTGTLVSGQYEIKGPIAVGGCGFVYLAWDVNVGQYVVIKGLINSRDPAAVSQAVQEKQFLANLRDPSIVSIVNFISHENQSFIVEEFIDGISLKDLRKNTKGPLPVQEAVSYTLAILPSFEFLHSRRPRVIFCDGKLDNFMVQGNRVRMIDLGGARRENDALSDIYLTYGYSAPEADTNPSITSDLYTIARCLAILLCDFDFQHDSLYSLPTPQEEPIFAQYESLYRFLLRGTAKEPQDRFQSAIEMGHQLWGILREIVALDSGKPSSIESEFFATDLSERKDILDFHLLPQLKVDKEDPARGMIESGVILNDIQRQLVVFEQAAVRFPKSLEALLRIVNCKIESADLDAAEKELTHLFEHHTFDWRIAWLRGKLLLARRRSAEAFGYFDAVYSEIPGEVAPKLALGLASEMNEDLDTAVRFYDLVSRIDSNCTTAAFGLARCLSKQKDRQPAVQAYSRVPQSSYAYTDAVYGIVEVLVQSMSSPPTKDEIIQAAEVLKTIPRDNFKALMFEANLFSATLKQLESGGLKPDNSVNILTVPLLENDLRDTLEMTLRQCARLAATEQQRIELVDAANRIRRLTIV